MRTKILSLLPDDRTKQTLVRLQGSLSAKVGLHLNQLKKNSKKEQSLGLAHLLCSHEHKCWRLHFLSFDIWRWKASLLPCCHLPTYSVQSVSPHYNWDGYGVQLELKYWEKIIFWQGFSPTTTWLSTVATGLSITTLQHSTNVSIALLLSLDFGLALLQVGLWQSLIWYRLLLLSYSYHHLSYSCLLLLLLPIILSLSCYHQRRQ